MRTFSSADITDAFQQWKKLPDDRWVPAADVRALLGVLRSLYVFADKWTPQHVYEPGVPRALWDAADILEKYQEGGRGGSLQEPAVEEHVCGMQGFGALGDVCPPCHRAYERAVRRGHEGGRDGAAD
jgi:hypothetical protein